VGTVDGFGGFNSWGRRCDRNQAPSITQDAQSTQEQCSFESSPELFLLCNPVNWNVGLAHIKQWLKESRVYRWECIYFIACMCVSLCMYMSLSVCVSLCMCMSLSESVSQCVCPSQFACLYVSLCVSLSVSLSPCVCFCLIVCLPQCCVYLGLRSVYIFLEEGVSSWMRVSLWVCVSL